MVTWRSWGVKAVLREAGRLHRPFNARPGGWASRANLVSPFPRIDASEKSVWRRRRGWRIVREDEVWIALGRFLDAPKALPARQQLRPLWKGARRSPGPPAHHIPGR